MNRLFRPLLLSATALVPIMTPAQEVTVSISGGHPELQDLLEGNSLALSLGEQEDSTPADYIAAARADYRRLLTGLYAEGYYGGAISILVDGREASGIAPLDAPAAVGTIAIAVDAGPRFTFGTVGVAPVAPGTILPERFATGRTAESGLVQSAVNAAVDGWREVGHPLAEATGQDIRAIHAENRLDVAVEIQPGPQLTFGPLAVTGHERVRPERIVEIAGLPTGEVYDPDAIALAQMRLRRTGAFSSVALVEGDAPGPGDTLPVTAQVSEMAPRRLGFGAEISSTEGLALTAYWLHRNLLGGAERFRVDGAITGIQSELADDNDGTDVKLTLSFGRPATVHPDVDLTAELSLERLDEPDYLLTQAIGEVGFVRYVRDDLTYQGGVGFITAREETPQQIRDYTLVTLPLGATLDRRNDQFDASAGYYIDVEVTPFLGITGSDDGGRLYADARYYRSFGANDRFTFAVRGQAGSVWGADLLAAPRDFLFYSGGGGTVRGQPYQDLGITLSRDSGETLRIGGRSFVGAQAEARVDITRLLGVVAFYDFGAISADSLPDAESPWHAGAGLGVRYDTAIGPIRLDLATPASGDDAGQSLQVYIGIGQAF